MAIGVGKTKITNAYAFSARPLESLYDFVTTIDRADLLKYTLLTLAICYVLKQIKFSISLLPGIAISSIVVYFLAVRTKSSDNNRHADLVSKIHDLRRASSLALDYMYLEPEVVDFFAKEIEFRSFASDSYDRCLAGCDSILQLKYGVEAGVPRCSSDIDTGHSLRVTSLNAFSEIEFNLPSNDLLHDKLSAATHELHGIILRLLDEMKRDCQSVQREVVLDDNTRAPFASSALGDKLDANSLY